MMGCMPRLDEKGIITNIIFLLILAAGIAGGIYLVSHPQIFKPKAAVDGTRIEVVDDTGNPITTIATQSARLKLTYIPPVTSAKEVKTMLIAYVPPGGVATVYPDAPVPDPESFVKNTMIPAMNSGTKFHGYSDSNTQSEINFSLAAEDIHIINSTPPVRQDNYLGFPPKAANQPGYLDMPTIFSSQDICNVAKKKDIRAVILMMADYGDYAPKGFEDYITGNKGIPTNGPILRGLQYCDDKTIYIVAPVYTRGLAEALESYGHHLEGVFRHFKSSDYASWSDENAARNGSLMGKGDSCGTDHNPPNGRQEYDASNPANFQSDCRNWKADGTGAKETLNCNLWGCNRAGWLVWWMQNMPSSWWSYVANPDGGSSGTTSSAYPTNFRIANSPAFLNSAPEQLFTGNGQIVDWMLSPGDGHKTIYAQFKVEGAWQSAISTSVDLITLAPTPTPTPTAFPTNCRSILSLSECNNAGCAWYSCAESCWPSNIDINTVCPTPAPTQSAAVGSISCDPVSTPVTGLSTYNISASYSKFTSGYPSADICVKMDNGSYVLFAGGGGPDGNISEQAVWIQRTHSYQFTLFNVPSGGSRCQGEEKTSCQVNLP